MTLRALSAQRFPAALNRQDRSAKDAAAGGRSRNEPFAARASRTAGLGSWELDLATRKLTWSDEARCLHEVPAGFELTLETALSLYPPQSRSMLDSAIEASIATGSSWDLELSFKSATGRAVWMRSTGIAEFDGGKAVSVVGAFQDVTAARAAVEALRNALGEANVVNEVRRSRLANLNHDIRTPMSAVVGSCYLLRSALLDTDQQALLSTIEASVKSILNLTTAMTDPVDMEADAEAGAEVSAEVIAEAGAEAGAEVSAKADPERHARLPGLHVLIADDSLHTLEVARAILEREGACVSAALNGMEAVALLRATPDAFDVVLMDVQMPVLDGVNAVRQIRGDLRLEGLPVIAVTGAAHESDRRRALEAGMDGLIIKPFEPDALVGLLRAQVKRARGVAPSPRTLRIEALRVEWPSIEGINADDVQNRLEGDLPLFTRLLRGLCQEFSDLAMPFPFPRSTADMAAVAARLHKLGGMAGLLSAWAVRNAAVSGEAEMRAGVHSEEATVALAAVEPPMRQLVRAIEHWLTQPGQSHDDNAAAVPAKPLDAATLTHWQSLLRSQDFEALAEFRELAPRLRAAWGDARFQTVEADIERLDFGSALARSLANDCVAGP